MEDGEKKRLRVWVESLKGKKKITHDGENDDNGFRSRSGRV